MYVCVCVCGVPIILAQHIGRFRAAQMLRQLRQYLYFCTSNARKLSTT
jgi:hypothetical protein